MIIDAHAHLRKSQKGKVSGRDVFSVGTEKAISAARSVRCYRLI